MFDIEKGEVYGRRGWIVRHASSREVVSGGFPFRTERTAQKFVVRLAGLTIADGSRFDWEAPGVRERLATGCGQDGGSLTKTLANLRTDVELEAIDEPKPQPTDLQSPFRSVTELRAHLRATAAKYVGHDNGKARRLTVTASDKTLGIAPGGQLIYRREAPRIWVIATSLTLAAVTRDGIEDEREAHELASWLETQVTDVDGTPFRFGTADVDDRIAKWRSMRGLSLEDEVTLLRAAFDRSKGRTCTWPTDMAGRVSRSRSLHDREVIAQRAAAGGYTVERPWDLVMRDEIEFDIMVSGRYGRRLAGDRPPAFGTTVTLRGVIARRVSHTEHGVGLAFERGGLRWSDTNGNHGTVLGDAWRFDAYALVEPVIYRRRDAEIDALSAASWRGANAESLAFSIGLSETVRMALMRAVRGATIDELEGKLFTRDAREAAVELRDAPPEELDRTLMAVRGFLDEHEAWDRLSMEPSISASAALLLAAAAERRRRRLGPLDQEYWSGPDHAEHVRQQDTIDVGSLRELPSRVLEGALDYAQARHDANAGLRPDVRASAMEAAGERWQAAADALQVGLSPSADVADDRFPR